MPVVFLRKHIIQRSEKSRNYSCHIVRHSVGDLIKLARIQMQFASKILTSKCSLREHTPYVDFYPCSHLSEMFILAFRFYVIWNDRICNKVAKKPVEKGVASNLLKMALPREDVDNVQRQRSAFAFALWNLRHHKLQDTNHLVLPLRSNDSFRSYEGTEASEWWKML